MNTRKEFFNSLALAFLYGVIFYAVIFVMFQRGILRQVPDSDTFAALWDGGWYRSVVERGYEYSDSTASNSAFFMLFPMVWKLTHLSGYGIAFLNIVFFAIGFGIFCTVYSFTVVEKLVLISVPSVYLCFVPYSESLSILFLSVAIWGMVKNKRYVIWIGLFFAALTRPPNTVLILAFLIAELVCSDRRSVFSSVKNYFLNYGIPTIAGLLFFTWYQYNDTGVWFAFFKQEKQWGHEFKWPTFPFSSMNGLRILWLNGVAMFLGFISLLLLIKIGIKWLIKNKVYSDKILAVTFLFFTAMLLKTVFFMPTWVTYSTNVFDIHRYVFISPFFWVFVHRYTKSGAYKPLDYLWVFLLSNAFWLLFHHYLHITYFVYFNFGTIFIMLYMLFANKKLSWPALVIFALQVFLMLDMFQTFISPALPG